MVTPKLSAKNGGAYVKLADRPDPATLIPMFDLGEVPEVVYETVMVPAQGGGECELTLPVDPLAFLCNKLAFAIRRMEAADPAHFSPQRYAATIKDFVKCMSEYHAGISGESEARPAEGAQRALIPDDDRAVPRGAPRPRETAAVGTGAPSGVDFGVSTDNPFAG